MNVDSIDSSTKILKGVLFCNGNLYGSIPIGHSMTAKKKNYEVVKKMIKLLHNDDHKWIICVDMKMVNFLLGQQSGCTKFPCFLCMWHTCAKDKHWVQQELQWCS